MGAKDRDDTDITDKEIFKVTCSSKFFVMKILAY